jgi:monoterpene epsilon-lactone hydrolase
MSVRAELVRAGLHLFLKRKSDDEPDLAKIRRGIDRTTWWVQNPPRTTRGIKVDVGGRPAVRVTTPRSRADHHILYLHGGAYIYGSPLLYRDFSWRIANAARAVVWMLDYRLAPEHPFPAALDDASCAYHWLLAEGADPRRTAVMGDSAGGGLTFGTLLKLRDEGKPMPAAAAGLSPWTDLTITSESSRLFAKTDPMLSLGDAKYYVAWYLGDADRRNPYASPVFGDPTGLPPSLIQVGDDEMLRDDAVTMAERLRVAGVPAELELWPRMPHVWHMLARVVPEGQRAIERIGSFVQQQWAQSAP